MDSIKNGTKKTKRIGFAACTLIYINMYINQFIKEFAKIQKYQYKFCIFNVCNITYCLTQFYMFLFIHLLFEQFCQTL